ncbi:hypothetical protein U5B43_04005 [Campylobacter sp. 9BO]|uniref:hypothetical protein n=1 Tax=Campylobacter sp. 9BO TaxID=3424759 RepID=UPI003D33914C
MLSINELNELEAKFNTLKTKRKPIQKNQNLYKYLSILALFIALSVASFNFFTKQKSIKTEQNSTQNLNTQNKSEVALLKAKISELNFKLSQTTKNAQIEQEKDKKDLSKKSEQGYLSLNVIELKNIENLTQQDTSTLEDKSQKQKPKITLKPAKQTVQNESILDFNELIELANSAYKNSEFTKALELAIMANEIDEQKEDSWLIFAKAKFKLGDKAGALRALESYNTNKNKKSVNLLIREIKKGEI